MPSPFPGMNPYLEQPAVWQDFHQSLVTHIREALAGQVRPQFSVKIEESVFIHEPSGDERRRRLARPDIALFENSGRGSVAVAEAPVNSVAAQIARLPEIEIEKHSFIEIHDRHSRDLVTMIEVLSPSNKQYGPDRDQYLTKRTLFLHSAVNVVEIDLLRGGPRLPLTGVSECDYCLVVSRPANGPMSRPGLCPCAIRCRPFRFLCAVRHGMRRSIFRRCCTRCMTRRVMKTTSMTCRPSRHSPR